MLANLKLKIVCLLLGHRYYVVQNFSAYSRRIACERCKKSFGMNDQVQAVIPWCEDLSEMYFELFGHKEIKPWR